MRKIVFLFLMSTVLALGVSIRILSFPEGSVFVDGKFVGESPVIVDVEKGEHEIVIRREGFLEERKIIEVTVPKTVSFKLVASPYLFKEAIPIAVTQYEMTETPPRETPEEREFENKLLEVLGKMNINVEKIELNENDVKNLVEEFNFDVLDKIMEKFPESRYSIVGQFVHISKENIIEGRVEIWIYDLKKKEILTSMSLEKRGKNLDNIIVNILKEISPRLTDLLVKEELKHIKVLKKEEGDVIIKEIDYKDYPDIKIKFFVLNPKGEVETSLKKDNVVLLEDERKIDDLELTGRYDKNTYVILAIDTSGSMKQYMEILKTSAIEFLESMPEGLNYSLVVFGRKKEPVVDVYPSKATPFISNKDVLKWIIRSLKSYGSTPLYDAIFTSLKLLEGVEGTKILVVFTDGKDSNYDETGPGSVRTLEDVLTTLKIVKPITYILGFGKKIDEKVLNKIAEESNGRFLKINKAEEIKEVYSSIAKKLRNVYTLSYKTLGGKLLRVVIEDGYRAETEISLNRPPEKPKIISGTGEQLGDTVLLEWECKDPDDDVLIYQILFGKDPGSLKKIAEVKGNKYEIRNLELDTTYYWRVIAFDGTSFTASDLMKFTTKAKKMTKEEVLKELEIGNYELIMKKMERGETVLPEDEFLALYVRALSKYVSEGGEVKNLDEIKKEIEDAMILFPKSPKLRGALAEVYLMEGNIKKAKEELEMAIKMGLEKTWVDSIKIRIADIEGKQKEVVDVVEKMIRSGEPDSMMKAADILLERGEEERALEVVRKLRKMNPKNLIFLKKEVRILREIGKLDEALEVIEEGLKINPNDPDLIKSKVEILIKQGEIKEAQVFMEKIAEEVLSENVELLRLKAIVLVELGKKDEALKALKSAIELEPEDISLKRYYIKIAKAQDTEGILEIDKREGPVIKVLKPKKTIIEKGYVVVRLRVTDNVAVERVKINEKNLITFERSSVIVVEKVDLKGRITPIRIEAVDGAGNVDKKEIFVISRKRGEPLNIICATAGDKGLWLFDVSDPKKPKKVGHIDFIKNAFNVFALNNQLFVLSKEDLSVVDVSNFLSPRRIASFEIENAKDTYVKNNYVYAVYEEEFGVIDVSDFTKPNIIGSVKLPEEAYEVFISNDYAYIADGKSGLIILDVSDPKNIKKIGHIDLLDSRGVLVSENHAYVADGTSQDLVILDISQPSNPKVLSRLECDKGSAKKLAISGNYVYMLTAHSLVIIDVSDPKNARILNDVNLSNPEGICVIENHAFVTDKKEGLISIEIINPANPKVVSKMKGEMYELCDLGKGLKVKNKSPNTPYYLNPKNQATNVSINTLLLWACNDPNGDKLIYDIYFGENPAPPLVESNYTSTSYTPRNLRHGVTYYWKIVAKDGKGGVKEGPVWEFETARKPNTPPNVPSNPSPANNTVDVPINVTLNWYCNDPDGDILKYDIYLGETVMHPITVGLLMDYSGSMSSGDINAMENGVTAFVKNMSYKDKGFIAKFDDKWKFYPASGFYGKSNLRSNITAGFPGGGGTALYDTIYDSLERINKDMSENKKVLVVFTDGRDNESTYNIDQCINCAKAYGIKIYTVGYGDANMNALKKLAEETGGKYYYCPDERYLAAIYREISQVLRLVRIEKDYPNTSYNLVNLREKTIYYWKIVAKDGRGGITEGPVWKFTTAERTYALSETFDRIDTNIWIPYGNPRPRILKNVYGRDGVFDNNGDGWYDSGIITKEPLSLIPPFVIESDMYLEVTDKKNGCWIEPGFELVESNEILPRRDDERGKGRILMFRIGYHGDACWATPKEYRRHAYITFGFVTEDGKWDRGSSANYGIRRDDLIDGWHRYKIEVDSDGYVSFYVDDELLYRSSKKIDFEKLRRCYLRVGFRSSDYGGKAYHDFIRIESVSGSIGNKSPTSPINPNPSDNADDVPINATLSWSCSDPDGDNLTYDIYFGTSSNPPLVKSAHTSTLYNPVLSNTTQHIIGSCRKRWKRWNHWRSCVEFHDGIINTR